MALDKVWEAGGRAAGQGAAWGWWAVPRVLTPWLGLTDPFGVTGSRHVAAAGEASVPANQNPGKRTMSFHFFGVLLQGKENFSLDFHVSRSIIVGGALTAPWREPSTWVS